MSETTHRFGPHLQEAEAAAGGSKAGGPQRHRADHRGRDPLHGAQGAPTLKKAKAAAKTPKKVAAAAAKRPKKVVPKSAAKVKKAEPRGKH